MRVRCGDESSESACRHRVLFSVMVSLGEIVGVLYKIHWSGHTTTAAQKKQNARLVSAEAMYCPDSAALDRLISDWKQCARCQGFRHRTSGSMRVQRQEPPRGLGAKDGRCACRPLV